MDIGTGIRQSFDIYRHNFATLLLATLIVALGSIITVGILSGPLVGGLLLLCLKLMRGEKTGINEVFAHFNRFGATFPIIVAMWATMIITAVLAPIPIIGFLIRLAVGPFVGIMFILTVGLIVDRNLEAMAALRQAFDCFMTNPLMIWLYSFVIGLLSSIGALLFVIPVILTMPIGAVGMAIAYQELVDREGGIVKMKSNL